MAPVLGPVPSARTTRTALEAILDAVRRGEAELNEVELLACASLASDYALHDLVFAFAALSDEGRTTWARMKAEGAVGGKVVH